MQLCLQHPLVNMQNTNYCYLYRSWGLGVLPSKNIKILNQNYSMRMCLTSTFKNVCCIFQPTARYYRFVIYAVEHNLLIRRNLSVTFQLKLSTGSLLAWEANMIIMLQLYPIMMNQNRKRSTLKARNIAKSGFFSISTAISASLRRWHWNHVIVLRLPVPTSMQQLAHRNNHQPSR